MNEPRLTHEMGQWCAKAKSTVIKKIKDALFSADQSQPTKHQNAMAEAFYNELTMRMEQLGFIRSKKTGSIS